MSTRIKFSTGSRLSLLKMGFMSEYLASISKVKPRKINVEMGIYFRISIRFKIFLTVFHRYTSILSDHNNFQVDRTLLKILTKNFVYISPEVNQRLTGSSLFLYIFENKLTIGSGNERKVKGSNLTLSWPHTLHVTLDFN